jgi:hypothetical protein
VDISNRVSPELVAIIDDDVPDHPTLGDIYVARDVEIDGRYVYALFGNHGVRVIDVDTPSSPVLLSRTPNAGENGSSKFNTIARYGDTLFLASGDDDLIAWLDLTDPANPSYDAGKTFTAANSSAPGASVYDLHVVGSTLYAADWGSDDILVFDATSDLGAQTLNLFPIQEPRALDVSGDYLLAVGQLGLSMIDISSPSSPQLFDTVSSQSSDYLGAQNGVAVAPSFSLGVQLVDVSAPAALNEGAMVTYDAGASAAELAVQDGYLYAANSSSSEPAVTVHSNRAFPSVSQVGSTDGSARARSLFVAGDYMFVGVQADSLYYVYVYDVSAPAEPSLLGSGEVPQMPKDFVRYGDYLYVALGTSGLLVFDVSDPAAMRTVGFFAPNGDVETIDQERGVLAIGVDNGVDTGLHLYDLRETPDEPTRLGTVLDPTYYLGDVEIANGYVFAEAGQSDGMRVFDISSPSNPTNVTNVVSDMDGGVGAPSAVDIATIGEYVFFIDWPEESGPADAGIHVYKGIDVPASPSTPAEFQVVLLDNEYRGVTDGAYFYAYLFNGEIRIYPLVQ